MSWLEPGVEHVLAMGITHGKIGTHFPDHDDDY